MNELNFAMTSYAKNTGVSFIEKKKNQTQKSIRTRIFKTTFQKNIKGIRLLVDIIQLLVFPLRIN